ncbi:hypothetical protein KDA_31050 [Dictyobacter alpinus]|uniref:Uncharacterized protein n=1 Tax=Dictyobacter alpinus TaxID=2014873 RepID=A0A402B8C3_9CHLR|nr:Os1348 family NHLP clan protein [Dictyobacter alpinus]GCE27621.1 hypothetical protein KDA_31050 [Dictyobacter alpinus]
MSWSILNEILGLAIIDPVFQKKLLSSPLDAIYEREFVLSPEEIHVLQHIHVHDLAEFSQCIIDNLSPKQ